MKHNYHVFAMHNEIYPTEEDATLHNYFHCHTTAGNVEVKTKTESIYAHGKIRDRHYGVGVNPLSWNRNLASAAKVSNNNTIYIDITLYITYIAIYIAQ